MALAIAAGACVRATDAPPPGEADERYNIILILTDDQRWDTLQYMPTVQAELVDKGVTFTNGFVTTPECCPSRASILTGLYAHHHGVLTNSAPYGGFGQFQDDSTLATWLHAAGYRTGLVGLYINGYLPLQLDGYIPPGWDYWVTTFSAGATDEDEPQRNQGVYYDYEVYDNGEYSSRGAAAEDYSTDFLAEKALEFIGEPGGQPFFLLFSPYTPHAPATPAERHIGNLAGLEPWRPPSYNLPMRAQDEPFTDEEIAENDAFRQAQLETLLAVDDAVGAFIRALEESGELDETIILYTSDNGYLWGEHGMVFKKISQFQESLRVPFVLRHPGLTDVPRIDGRFVLNIDIAPTLADLAGVEWPGDVDGMSFEPLLVDGAAPWREDFLFEFWRRKGVDRVSGVVSEEWSYTEFSNGEGELYAMTDDPYQLHNLADDAEYASVIRALSARVHQLNGTMTFTDWAYLLFGLGNR